MMARPGGGSERKITVSKVTGKLSLIIITETLIRIPDLLLWDKYSK
jgi:hypothetical protein